MVIVEELSSITLKCLYLDFSWVLGCLEILQLSHILGPYKRYFWEELWMVMLFLPFNPFRSRGSWILVLDRFNYHKPYTSFSSASYWRCTLIESKILIHSSSCPTTSVVNVPTLLWYMVFPSLLIIHSRPKNITKQLKIIRKWYFYQLIDWWCLLYSSVCSPWTNNCTSRCWRLWWLS